MAILGIDYGDRKIGVAISVNDNSLAVPLEIIINEGQQKAINDIQKICSENSVEKIVVGVPLTLGSNSDTESMRQKDIDNKQMQKVLDFFNALKNSFEIPVIAEDERMSTKLAQTLQKNFIKDKGKDDAVAAMVVLQNYLDKNN